MLWWTAGTGGWDLVKQGSSGNRKSVACPRRFATQGAADGDEDEGQAVQVMGRWASDIFHVESSCILEGRRLKLISHFVDAPAPAPFQSAAGQRRALPASSRSMLPASRVKDSGQRGAAAAAGGRGGAGAAKEGGRGRGAGGRGSAGKMWVTPEGRVYAYAKEGAQRVEGQEGARQAVEAAKQAAQVG